jgi:hypothetical protein
LQSFHTTALERSHIRTSKIWGAAAEKMVKIHVVKSHRPGTLFASVSVVAMTASMLIGANIASADQVQVQSYQRANQTEACAAQPGETPWQASWGPDSSWSPSWEQWANNGTGGWVCTRSITWARTPVAPTSTTPAVPCADGGTCAVGNIGPGGGLVFLISGGITYEMAPKTWSGGSEDPTYGWCDNTSDVTGAASVAVGAGASNTAAMDAACTTGAARVASALVFGGKTDWFLPSKDELFEMYSYSLVMPASVAATYAFVGATYWSSTQNSASFASTLSFSGGSVGNVFKLLAVRVRPVRAF